MDYHAIHGHDIASFDAPSTHRLPTIAASQALDELESDSVAHISTGLEALDRVLLGSSSVGSGDAGHHGGIKRGQVTEIWGPPGSGKTALGIQLVTSALANGNGVVWVDCFQRVQSQRFTNVFSHLKKSPDSDGANNQLDVVQDKLAHYSCLTLAHLLALISQPTTNLIASDVSLVVINCLSALVNSSLPKAHGSKASSKFTKGQTPSAKRLQGLQSLMNSLQKLAATRNCAVVLLTQCATKMQSEYGATLVPAVNASVWEQGVSTRVVLFRDWTWQANKSTSVFLAGPQKVDGQAVDEAMEHLSAFQIEDIGVSSTPYDHATNRPSIDVATTMSGQPKRKLGQTGLEVPDSEDDEDYGWAEEDEAALPPPPSQWQGSEDIILGQEIGASDDDLEEPYRYWEDEDGEIGEGDRSKSEEAT